MRAALAPAVVLAGLLAACVTEDLHPIDRKWEMSTDQPVVAGAEQAPLISPVPGPAAAKAQDATSATAAETADQAHAASTPGGPAQNQAQSQPGHEQGHAPGAGESQDESQGQPQCQNKEDLLKLLTPATEEGLEPDFLSDTPPSPFHRLGHNVIRGMDGSWSKLYSIKSEVSADILHVLQTTVPNFPTAENTPSPANGKPTEIVKYVLHKDFYQDTTFPNPTIKLGVLESIPNPKIADMLIVTAPPETLLFIDQVLDKLLADLPQIELQVRVVEVNLDDLLQWDTKVGINKLSNPSLPFDPATNPVSGNFGAGFPILDGGGAGTPTGFGAAFGSFIPQTSLAGFLTSLQGVHKRRARGRAALVAAVHRRQRADLVAHGHGAERPSRADQHGQQGAGVHGHGPRRQRADQHHLPGHGREGGDDPVHRQRGRDPHRSLGGRLGGDGRGAVQSRGHPRWRRR